MANSPTPHGTEPPNSLGWTTIGVLLALCGVAASMWLSMAMGLKACPLCLYQRAFLMSAAAVLLVGLATELRRWPIVPLLALPAVAAGLTVAGFHVYLEQSGKLECPAGILGLGTAPQQSLAALAALFVVLLIPQFAGGRLVGALGAVVLGLGLAVGAIASAPPMPGPPSEPYAQPPDVCRPPFYAAANAMEEP